MSNKDINVYTCEILAKEPIVHVTTIHVAATEKKAKEWAKRINKDFKKKGWYEHKCKAVWTKWIVYPGGDRKV